MSSFQSEKPPVVFLLALWGESYIKNFFEFGLPSLLAPGNIPMMSRTYACSFLFLTKKGDIPFFKAQSVFQKLLSYCQIDFIEISDLIFDKNYSATLTLSYERGMRSRGAQMCHTYFFFLVSDYIMADGSLGNIIPYLREGYSGITTGNFLVVEEYISPLLAERMDSHEENLLSLNPREMLALCLPYLHPVSTAHTVSQSYTHATHANRLFWKVNEHIMVGRFYLRHMLCIKPERDDYIIGAPCDYSFIPEMCPSGNIAHIQDSDEYCAVEMAPFAYEQSHIKPGGYDIPSLANQLSRWTTVVHRANAHIPTIFHSVDLPQLPLAVVQESAHFILAIEHHLSSEPHPIRGHYYWKSCIESVLYQILQLKKRSHYFQQGTLFGIVGSPTFSPIWGERKDDYALLKMSPPPPLSPSKKQRFKACLKKSMTGVSPHPSFWHLDWLDDLRMKEDLQRKLSRQAAYMAIAFEPMGEIINWLESHYKGCFSYQWHDLLMTRNSSDLEELFCEKQHVFIWLTDRYVRELGAVLRKCARHLPPGGSITVYLKPKKAAYHKKWKNSLSCIADLLGSQLTCEKMLLHYNFSRAHFERAHTRNSRRAFASRKHLWTRGFGLIGLSTLSIACTMGNLFSRLGIVPQKKWTSAMMEFKSL
jgi:hypothetical protein